MMRLVLVIVQPVMIQSMSLVEIRLSLPRPNTYDSCRRSLIGHGNSYDGSENSQEENVKLTI